MDLTNLEIAILKALENRQGRESAISRAALVAEIRAGMGVENSTDGEKKTKSEDSFPGERVIRSILKHLVCFHGERIGSCHRGYYMVETSEELERACKYYHSYAMSLLHVEARLRNTSLAELMGQIAMKL